MSEYQYYEFAALDRPLTQSDMARLRAVSTRGRITASSFVNHYEWGDLKADPMDWMRRYFDAFVYVASWGSCHLSLRLPLATFQQSAIQAFLDGPSLSAEATATHWIFSWSIEESDDYERFAADDGSGWMSRLLPLRNELARGDLRPLYLGWLAGTLMAEDTEFAPTAPAGLAELTPAQRALTEFIYVDVDMLAAAATGGESVTSDAKARAADLDAWLAACSREDLLAVVAPLARDQTSEAVDEFRRRHAAWAQLSRPPATSASERVQVGQLRATAAALAVERLAREARAEAARMAARRSRREKELRALMQQVDLRWDAIDTLARQATAAAYSQLVRALGDLAEGYALTGNEAEFERILLAWLQPYSKRVGLKNRLVKAGLWR